MAPGYSAENQRTVLESELFRTEIVGVESVGSAVIAATGLIDRGVQLIELCGAFGKEGAHQVITTVESDVPIGFVSFTTQENDKLSIVTQSSNG